MNALLPPFVSSERADTAEVFTELLYRIRKGRYQLSAEEAKALKKCENDLQVCGVLGALLLYRWSTRAYIHDFVFFRFAFCALCRCGRVLRQQRENRQRCVRLGEELTTTKRGFRCDFMHADTRADHWIHDGGWILQVRARRLLFVFSSPSSTHAFRSILPVH